MALGWPWGGLGWLASSRLYFCFLLFLENDRKAGRESGLAHRPRLGYTFLAYVSRGKQTQRGREFPQPTAAIGKRGVPALQRVPALLRADAAGKKGRVDRRSRLYGFTRQRPPREAGWYHSSLARHLCQPAPGYRGSPQHHRHPRRREHRAARRPPAPPARARRTPRVNDDGYLAGPPELIVEV